MRKLRTADNMQSVIMDIMTEHNFYPFEMFVGFGPHEDCDAQELNGLTLHNHPYQDLLISYTGLYEFAGEQYPFQTLEVAHYRDDGMMDLGMRFVIIREKWYPTEIYQIFSRRWKTCLNVLNNDGTRFTVFSGYGDVVSLSRTWATNLRDQGFLARTKERWGISYAAPRLIEARLIEPYMVAEGRVLDMHGNSVKEVTRHNANAFTYQVADNIYPIGAHQPLQVLPQSKKKVVNK